MNGAKTRDFIEKRICGQADQLIADIDYSAIDPDYDSISWKDTDSLLSPLPGGRPQMTPQTLKRLMG